MALVICTVPGCDTTAGCKCNSRALNGYAMAPEQPWERQVASIICGHHFIQRLDEYDHATFEMFVREVLRTNRR